MIGSLIHRAIRGEKTDRPPFWFMRQAGRYLPEYREIRARTRNFLTLVYTPELASEVTLQPIRRFDMDAAILFSDILVVPHALGVDVQFVEGEGPQLPPIRTGNAVTSLELKPQIFDPVMETLRKTRRELAPEKSLIGFCGAPWTVACYMAEGGGSKSFEHTRTFAQSDKTSFMQLIDKISEASVHYLSLQVEAGADILQLFDSWAGVLSENEYKDWVIAPTKKLVSRIKKLYPSIPVIGFPRGSGVMLETYARETGVDAVSIDSQTPLTWVCDNVKIPFQGNLDPVLLMTDKKGAVAQTRHIIDSWKNRPFIFNLGHGILPSTPLENVQAICDAIREKR